MPSAFHVSLNVANLEYSVGFYRLLFGCEPTKWFPDYAKFELKEPSLVLALEPAKVSPGGTLNHLGIRVKDQAEITAFEKRLSAVGVTVQRLDDIECCYSRQSKIVFRDPDQNLVEIYVHEGDVDRKGAPATPREATEIPSAAPAAWEHLVGSPFPEKIPAARATLAEVRLRGTFNQSQNCDRIDAILSASAEALASGGQLLLHLLVADRPFAGALPPLPPPADQVKHVPTEAEIIEAVERAGFAYLELKRLSHAPVMQLGDVELRELLLHAKKRRESEPGETREVIYLGPFSRLEDDRGRVFSRGRRVSVETEELEWLQTQGWLGQFAVLSSDGKACGVGESR